MWDNERRNAVCSLFVKKESATYNFVRSVPVRVFAGGNIMPVFTNALFFVMAVVFIGSGIYCLTAPLDNLWAAQERALLARGLAPQRNVRWENQVRARAIPCLILGFLCAGGALAMVVGSAIQPPKMSGMAVEGRELTQEEADRCHRDVVECVVMYAPRK